MQEKELNVIKPAIEERMKKEIKEIKKLYQATIDGGSPLNFHSKCDNIRNTFTLIKSTENRRFGGFNSEPWKTSKDLKFIDDKNAFLFSLDKQKIYPYKEDGYAICFYENRGPIFGNAHDISIVGNPLKEKKSYTKESLSCCSYQFQGDKNALSEDGRGRCFNLKEYEVFQVIFK